MYRPTTNLLTSKIKILEFVSLIENKTENTFCAIDHLINLINIYVRTVYYCLHIRISLYLLGILLTVTKFRFLFHQLSRIGSKSIELTLHDLWPVLPWGPPLFMGSAKLYEKIRVAELFHTAELSLKLIYVDTGTKVPQHAKNAHEMVHIFTGTHAKIGPIDEWLKEVSKTFYEFLPTAPQVLQVKG